MCNAKEVWPISITKYHTVLTPKCPSWLRYLRFSVIENQSLRSTCKILIQPSVTFVHPSQCTKTKAFDHKITRWMYRCFTFFANTTTAVEHRSSHRLMECYRDTLSAKDRLGAINLPVRICLHHTTINTRKDYHASTFMIIRIKHNPTILALELSTWKELHKMVTSHTDQYTKRILCINIHDNTHQA